MIRVLIADDHPVYRDGIRAALGQVETISVVGEASEGAEAVAQALALEPDVVLMDLRMPGTSGLEAIALLRAQAPAVRVIALTMFDDDHSVRAALRAGACGYLVKGTPREGILRTVAAVAAGEVVFGAAAAVTVQRLLTSTSALPRSSPSLIDLSEREVEVLDLVARGMTNPEIARRLVLSDKTVRNHVSNIFTKLGTSDRAQTVAKARDAGLGTGAT